MKGMKLIIITLLCVFLTSCRVEKLNVIIQLMILHLSEQISIIKDFTIKYIDYK